MSVGHETSGGLRDWSLKKLPHITYLTLSDHSRSTAYNHKEKHVSYNRLKSNYPIENLFTKQKTLAVFVLNLAWGQQFIYFCLWSDQKKSNGRIWQVNNRMICYNVYHNHFYKWFIIIYIYISWYYLYFITNQSCDTL